MWLFHTIETARRPAALARALQEPLADGFDADCAEGGCR